MDVNIWIFKMDDEFGARGHASLNVESLKTIMELRKRRVKMSEEIVSRLQGTLSKVLPKKVKLAQPTLYHGGWDQYMTEFCKTGGVIECAPPLCQMNQLKFPSVSFLIEPDGFVKLIGSYDKFCGVEMVNVGCFAPQTSLP